MLLRALPWAIWLALTIFSVATRSGLMLPGIGLLVLGGLTLVGALLPSRPEMFNFSEKERFLRIPPAYRAPVIARMRETLDGICASTMLVICAAQWIEWRSARGEPSGAMVGGLIAITVLTTPLVLILTLRVNTAVDEAERRWRAATPRER